MKNCSIGYSVFSLSFKFLIYKLGKLNRMRPKFLVKPETWESFDYDKWYAMRISWSVTLFIMLCLEPPKYNNTVLKFTFSLLKDGQRSKKTKNKKRNECFLKMISCSLAKHQKSLVGVTKKITGQRKECRIPFQPNSVTKFWKHKSPPVKSIFFLYFTSADSSAVSREL